MPNLLYLIRTTTLLFSFSILLSATSTKQARIDRVLNATHILNEQWYDSTSGLFQQLWWNSGAILATIGDIALLTPSFRQQATQVFATSLTTAKASNPYVPNSWIDEWYDDEGWWALAWIKAYDVTKAKRYLDAADSIYSDLLTGNEAICGGHWWSKARVSNTAITNELYLAVAASLANRLPTNSLYRAHAQVQADWFLQSDLINANKTINDNLDLSTCKGTGPVYSYNQGVILGALLELHTLTGNETYLSTALEIALAAITHLSASTDGILTDPNYPQIPDTTGAQFKGIFARNLAHLSNHDLTAPSDRTALSRFVQANADAIWTRNRRAEDGALGVFWQGPLKGVSAAAHSSALDCLFAAAAVTDREAEECEGGDDGCVVVVTTVVTVVATPSPAL